MRKGGARTDGRRALQHRNPQQMPAATVLSWQAIHAMEEASKAKAALLISRMQRRHSVIVAEKKRQAEAATVMARAERSRVERRTFAAKREAATNTIQRYCRGRFGVKDAARMAMRKELSVLHACHEAWIACSSCSGAEQGFTRADYYTMLGKVRRTARSRSAQPPWTPRPA